MQRLETGSGNQRFGQGHRLEINSISLFLTVEETEAPQKTHAHAVRAGKLRTQRPWTEDLHAVRQQCWRLIHNNALIIFFSNQTFWIKKIGAFPLTLSTPILRKIRFNARMLWYFGWFYTGIYRKTTVDTGMQLRVKTSKQKRGRGAATKHYPQNNDNNNKALRGIWWRKDASAKGVTVRRQRVQLLQWKHTLQNVKTPVAALLGTT